MKVALYRTEYGSTIIFESNEMAGDNKYLQVSEVIDIEFTLIKEDELIKKEVDLLDKQIQQVQAAAHIKTSELEQRKAELLAIPDLRESEDV